MKQQKDREPYIKKSESGDQFFVMVWARKRMNMPSGYKIKKVFFKKKAAEKYLKNEMKDEK